jgi:MoxR-like ATPase
MRDGADIPALLRCLCEGVIERDRVMRVALLGALAGENVLLLGPPGTAKSLVARRLAAAFEGARYFQYLLTRFTSPDELFGPVSLRQLKENDAFSRKTEGYLPSAEVAFIDEIFKASSAILNSLLTIINERLYFNGSQVVRAPLLVLIAASNEIPAEEELVALYDRFAVRLDVFPITDIENVLRMLRDPEPTGDFRVPDALRLTVDDVHEVRRAANATTLSPAVERVLVRMKREIDDLADGAADEPWRFYVSDRRWRQALRLLRAGTHLSGRDVVHVVDCGLLRHCLWNRPEDAQLIAQRLDAALEEVATAFDLDLKPVAARWVRLLGEMRDHEGVGRPIYDGYVLTHGGTRYVMTDLRAAAAMKNTFDSVKSTTFWFDAKANTVRKVRVRQDGAVLFNAGYATVPVGDAATFAGQVRAGHLPVFEEGGVQVDRKVNPGMALDFSGIDGEIQAMWLKEIARLRETLHERQDALGRAATEVDELVRAHLFVGEAEVRGLRAGLLRVELVLKEWEAKLRTIEEALADLTEYETADIDATGPVSADSAIRLLGPTPRATPAARR